MNLNLCADGDFGQEKREKEIVLGRRGRRKPDKKEEKVLLMNGRGVDPPIHDPGL